jgi:hypothetical protein
MALTEINTFLEDLFSRRGEAAVSGNANRLGIESTGGHVVEMTPFEPDAATYRNWYYYNTATNALMRKIVLDNKPSTVAFWKRVGG